VERRYSHTFNDLAFPTFPPPNTSGTSVVNQVQDVHNELVERAGGVLEFGAEPADQAAFFFLGPFDAAQGSTLGVQDDQPAEASLSVRRPSRPVFWPRGSDKFRAVPLSISR
jgi:hypothetical protein